MALSTTTAITTSTVNSGSFPTTTLPNIAEVPANEDFGIKFIKILLTNGRRVMHTVLQWGTPCKPLDVDLITYLNNLPPTSTANFHTDTHREHKFTHSEEQQIKESTTCEAFDITLLYSIIRVACENVAGFHDKEAWNPSGTQLENLVTRIICHRNDLFRSKLAMTNTEFMDKTYTLRTLFNDTLISAQQRYNQSKIEVNDEFEKITDSIEKIITEPLQIDIFLKEFGQAILQDFLKEALDHLKGTTEKDMLLDPISFLLGSRVCLPVQKIFTKVRVYESCCVSYDIDYEDLLTFPHQRPGLNQSMPTIILLDGEAGSGKTTLVTHLMSEWFNGGQGSFKGLDTYQLIFRVQCRNFHLSSFTDLLNDIFQPLLLKYGSLMPRLLKLCHLLIIIDGLDERNPNSHRLVTDVLDQFQKVPHCTFICTTRPIMVWEFIYTIVQRYKLTWFKLDGIPASHRAEFVRRYFSEIITVTNPHQSSPLISHTSIKATQTPESVKQTSQLIQEPTASSVQQVQEPSESLLDQKPKASLVQQQTPVSTSVQQLPTSSSLVQQEQILLPVSEQQPQASINGIEDLVKKIEKEKYKKYLWLPLNLAMLTWVYIFDPISDTKITMQVELYDLTHQLCQKKLEERLSNSNHTKFMNSSLLSKLKSWLTHLYQIEAEALSYNQLTLKENVADKLMSKCSELELPAEVVMATFLSKRTTHSARGNIKMYQAPHRNFQEYYAAMHISQILMQKKKHSFSIIKGKFMETWRKSCLPFLSGNAVKEALKQSLGNKKVDLHELRSFLQQLAGLLHLHFESIPENLAEDIVDLLRAKIFYLRSEEEWLGIIAEVIAVPEVLKAIADIFPVASRFPGDNIKLKDDQVLNYAALLPLLPRSYVEVDLRQNIYMLPDLEPCLKQHDVTIMVKHEKYINVNVLSCIPPMRASVALQGDPTSLLPQLVPSLTKHDTTIWVEQDQYLKQYIEILPYIEQFKLIVNIDCDPIGIETCLVQHICISLQLWYQYRNPTKTTLIPDHIMDYVLTRGSVKAFAGILNPGLATKLSSHIIKLSIVLHTDMQAAVIPSLYKFKHLKNIDIHLLMGVSEASLMPLPDIEQCYVTLHVSDVAAGMEKEIAAKISKLSPKRGYTVLSFPRTILDTEEWKKLLKALGQMRVKVKCALFVNPRSITDQETYSLKKPVHSQIGCNIFRMSDSEHSKWKHP